MESNIGNDAVTTAATGQKTRTKFIFKPRKGPSTRDEPSRQPDPRLLYSGYFDLVESVYRDHMSQDRYRIRSVTEPMWAYYCTMLLWEQL